MDRYTNASPDARIRDIAPFISALNLIIQKFATKSGTRVGRTLPKYFYDKPTAPVSLSSHLEAWQGFAMSVRPTFGQLMVNVYVLLYFSPRLLSLGKNSNVCMSAFLKPGNLADILFEFNKNSKGAMPSLPDKMVKSIKVRTSHLGYKKKLYRIMTTSARDTFFEKDGKKISVEDYFKTGMYPTVIIM